MKLTFDKYGIDVKGKTSGQTKTKCPQCIESRKNKSDTPLSVDIDRGIWNCHNCGWTGTLHVFDKKEYTKPKQNLTNLSEATKAWFAKRKIQETTLQYFKITESEEWMPKTHFNNKEVPDGKRKTINFNYFRNNELVNIKYRDATKCFRLVKDAELIFYNIDSIKGKNECLICEGEIDAMAIYQSGYFYALSVPNGASKSATAKLDYLDNSWEEFEDKEKIYIATDNDEAGGYLRKELIRRLGANRCYIVNFDDCKDANDFLIKYGEEKLHEQIKKAEPVPVKGIWRAESFKDKAIHLFKYGREKPLKLGMGFEKFDNCMSFRKGDFTVVSGIPSHGKSSAILWLMVILSSRYGWKWVIFAPENMPEEELFALLAAMFIGKSFHTENDFYKMSDSDFEIAFKFINEHFLFFKFDEADTTVEGICETIKESVKKYGVSGALIDPFNKIEHLIPKGQTETQYISEALDKFTTVTKTHGIHLFLIAHPIKLKKDPDTQQYEVPNLYSISGSANWYNKSDNGIIVYRNKDNSVDIHIQKVRWKFVGETGTIKMNYDYSTGRFAEEGKEFGLPYRYWLELKQLSYNHDSSYNPDKYTEPIKEPPLPF